MLDYLSSGTFGEENGMIGDAREHGLSCFLARLEDKSSCHLFVRVLWNCQCTVMGFQFV